MRVAFELTALQLDGGGTVRAIEHLRDRLEQDDRVELVELAHKPGRGNAIMRGLARELWYMPVALPREVRRQRAELLHCPSPLATLRPPVPQVITLHDAIGWDRPEWLTRANALQLKHVAAPAAKKAARVITSSEYSRGRLIELLELDPERVVAVPLGIDASFTPEAQPGDDELLAGLGVSAPFVLTVGTLQPRKNLEAALAAFERIDPAARDLQLVIAGARGWHEEELLARIDASPTKDHVLLLGRVSDEALHALYRAAAVFVFPSRYEGFGFPPLEAMASGTPVLSTTNTSLAEAVGDAALELDPDDPSQIADQLASVLDSPETAERLVAAGRQQAARFTWRACADATVAVYAQALGQ